HHGLTRSEQWCGQALERNDPTRDVDRAVDVVHARTDDSARDATRDRGTDFTISQHARERATEVDVTDRRLQRKETQAGAAIGGAVCLTRIARMHAQGRPLKVA